MSKVSYLKNLERWTLFQIFDCVSERWSPIYCSPTLAAMRLEIDALALKQPNREIMVRALGSMMDGLFTAGIEEYYVNSEDLDALDTKVS